MHSLNKDGHSVSDVPIESAPPPKFKRRRFWLVLLSIVLALAALNHFLLYPIGGFLSEAEVREMVFSGEPMTMREMISNLRDRGFAYIGLEFKPSDPDFLPGTPLSPIKLYFLRSGAAASARDYRKDASAFTFRDGASIRDLAYFVDVTLYDGGSFDFDRIVPTVALGVLFDQNERCIGLEVSGRRPQGVRTGSIFLRRWWPDRALRGPVYDKDADLSGPSPHPIPELPTFE